MHILHCPSVAAPVIALTFHHLCSALCISSSYSDPVSCLLLSELSVVLISFWYSLLPHVALLLQSFPQTGCMHLACICTTTRVLLFDHFSVASL